MVDAISQVQIEKRRSIVLLDATDGDVTFTIGLPNLAEPFVTAEFFRTDASAHSVTITDGANVNISLPTQYDAASVVSDGTGYAQKVVSPKYLVAPVISGTTVSGSTIGSKYSAGDAGTTQRRVKRISSIADDVFTDLWTITIPNGAHAAGFWMRVVGSLGGNDSTAVDEYMVAITRQSGEATSVEGDVIVTAVSQPSATGAETITMTFQCSGMTGAVGATQTFTVQGRITKGGGASDNHVIFCSAELLNQNSGGVTFT